MSEISEVLPKSVDPMAIFFAKGVGEVAQTLYGDNVKGVKLFGSFAKGTARLDSDIDILLVLDNIDPAKREELDAELYKAIADRDIATEGLHIIAVTKARLNNPPSDDTVLLEAIKSGVDIDFR